MLIIDPGLKLWGSERALLVTLDALVEANRQVVLLVPFRSEMVREVRNPAIRIIERDFGLLNHRSRWRRVRFILMLIALCRSEGITRIYLNQAGLSRLVRPVAQLLGLPFICHVRLREDVSRAARLTGTKGSPVTSIFVSRAMRALCSGLDRPDPHTCRVTAYDAYRLGRSWDDVSLGLRPPNDLLCVGRLERSKGQHVLICAVGLAKRLGTRMRVRLLGADTVGGSYEAELRALAVERGVSDLIDFGGYSLDPHGELSRVRFVPIPSHFEALGRVVLEAWDCGAIPVVCAKSGGCAEMVAASGGGLMYPEDTPESLAAALLEAMALSDEARLALLKRGRKWVANTLTLENYAGTLRQPLFAPV